MKKGNELDHIEKLIILIGVIITLLFACIGVFHSVSTEKEPYVSQLAEKIENTQDQKTADEEEKDFALKSETFEVKRNGNLGIEASDYFDGSAAELEKVKLDLSNVDLTSIGTYEAKGTYDKKEYSFEIEVTESENPYVTASNTSLKYMIGQYSSMEEVASIAGVEAIDMDGNDISDTIAGWPQELPNENGTYLYRISATDGNGNTGYIVITVTFQKV